MHVYTRPLKSNYFQMKKMLKTSFEEYGSNYAVWKLVDSMKV